MTKFKPLPAVIFLVISLFFMLPTRSQETEKKTKYPTSLDDYQLVARGRMSRERGARPVQIARMDNNGEILLACSEPRTVSGLRDQNIKFLTSQLELLVDWNLLEFNRKDRTYRTTIHICDPDNAHRIRQMVGTAVSHLEDELKPELDQLQGHLRKRGRQKNMFAILYAYIFHSYAMDQFSEEIYRKPQLSAEKPFWNGYAWAISPSQTFNTGVTAFPVGGITVFRVSAAGLPRLDIKQLLAFAKDLAGDEKVDDIELQKTFTEYHIIDKQGQLLVPFFDSGWSGRMELMAKKVYAKTIELIEVPKMQDILDMPTQAQAAMFLHYEIRYAMLKALLASGSIVAPVDFINGDNNRPEDLQHMIFVMTTKSAEAATDKTGK